MPFLLPPLSQAPGRNLPRESRVGGGDIEGQGELEETCRLGCALALPLPGAARELATEGPLASRKAALSNCAAQSQRSNRGG